MSDNKLTVAASVGNFEQCAALLQGGVVPGEINVALSLAAENGHDRICQLLLEHGANSNRVDILGVPVLVCAARSGFTQVCKVLLDAGAHINDEDAQGRTALMFAAQRGHVETCRLLVARGASPSFIPVGAERWYMTSMQRAVQSGQVDVVEYFVAECGEDIQQRTRDGRTLLGIAKPSVVKLLLALATQEEVAAAVTHEDAEGASATRVRGGPSPL